jgi:predicted nucleic acid-binding protein
MLTDTGPLVALLDSSDSNHVRCVAAGRNVAAGPMEMTWPCFTEAMYLLGSVGGYRYQEKALGLRSTGRLTLLDLTPAHIDRVAELMRKYQDTPMDLADASLVAIAESRRDRRLFTLDGHFRVYRLADGSSLDLIP